MTCSFWEAWSSTQPEGSVWSQASETLALESLQDNFVLLDSLWLVDISTLLSSSMLLLDACFKYFALRSKVATMSTLIRLNMFCAFVSITTCLAKDNFESNLLGFILAQNTSPTLKFLRKQHRTPWTMNPVHFDYHSDLLNLLGLVLLT